MPEKVEQINDHLLLVLLYAWRRLESLDTLSIRLKSMYVNVLNLENGSYR